MDDKSKINGINMATEKEMQYMLKGIEETSYYGLQKYTSRVQTKFRLIIQTCVLLLWRSIINIH
jgi:hypothetical protein